MDLIEEEQRSRIGAEPGQSGCPFHGPRKDPMLVSIQKELSPQGAAERDNIVEVAWVWEMRWALVRRHS